MSHKPTILCILDGWGLRAEEKDNAIALGHTPVFDRLMAEALTTKIKTYGPNVGLPEGQMGNSEVGHMNIGSGRIVWQDLPRINNAIADGTFLAGEKLKDFVAKLRAENGQAHLMGLCSPGGVHAHQDHMVVMANHLAGLGIKVMIHVITDGRDTAPRSGHAYVRVMLGQLHEDVTIASLSGRYFAMDRDNRWDRVSKAYHAMIGDGPHREGDVLSAIEASYHADIGDEFVEPVAFNHASMNDGDGLIMMNFRADRAREILTTFLDPKAADISAGPIRFSAILGMVSYSSALDPFIPALFEPQELPDTLGEVVAHHGGRQLRLAETEKYAHVTFFFNGGREDTFEGEERILVASPKVATYDLQPEMSAGEVTDALTQAIKAGAHDLIVVNYANPDMVGHTGVMEAALKAVAFVDECLGRVVEAVDEVGGTLLVTADHGNIELMMDQQTGEPQTSHTIGDVPFILYPAQQGRMLNQGSLCDIAPTILGLMGIKQPSAMTGKSLLN